MALPSAAIINHTCVCVCVCVMWIIWFTVPLAVETGKRWQTDEVVFLVGRASSSSSVDSLLLVLRL